MSSAVAKTTRRSRPDHLRSAFVCGLIPLITGTSIFLLWVLTRWDWLFVAGMLTIIAGIFVFLFGIACLAASRLDRPSGETGGSRRESLRRIMALLILLSNFPVAASIVVAVDTIRTRYVLTVVNDGPETLDAVVASGGGVRVEFGSIKPGGTVRRGFNIRKEGDLFLEWQAGQQEFREEVDGYVTSGIGRDLQVTIARDGSVKVMDRQRDPHGDRD